MDASGIGRFLILAGIVLLVLGGLLVLLGRVPVLGRLPGDILFRRDGLTIYVPLVTMLLLSIVLTIVLNVVVRLFR